MSTFSRHLGLEVETEGVSPDDIAESTRYWRYTTEGSLRGPHTEFVLSEPMKGNKFTNAMITLGKIFSSHNGIGVSDRCSIHVHVDARDLSPQQIYSVCLAFTIFEYPLYEISGGRHFNKYCVPVSQSYDVQTYIANICKRNLVSRSHRYAGLNLNSLSEFGSLEFRMHEGTLDTKRMYTWCKVLHNLVERSKDLSPEQILLMADEDVAGLAVMLFDDNVISVSDYYGQINYSSKVAESIHLMYLRSNCA